MARGDNASPAEVVGLLVQTAKRRAGRVASLNVRPVTFFVNPNRVIRAWWGVAGVEHANFCC